MDDILDRNEENLPHFGAQRYIQQDEDNSAFGDEYILSIVPPSKSGLLQGTSTHEINMNLQKILGGTKALKSDPCWGVDNEKWYLPLSILER